MNIMELSDINFWAVLAGTVASFLLGLLWYGPLFGKPWQKHVGLSDEDFKSANMGLIFGPAIVLTFIMGLVLASILPGYANWLDGMLLGAVLGLGVAAASLGVNYLFARRTLTLFLIDGLYIVFVMMIFGAIIGAWHV
jgi:hypothetical protein